MAEASSKTLLTPILSGRLASPFRYELVHQAHVFGHVSSDKILGSLDTCSNTDHSKLVAIQVHHQFVAVLDTQSLAERCRDDDSPTGA